MLSSALYERFSSRGNATFADKLLSAMRYEFGGHLEKPERGRGGPDRPGRRVMGAIPAPLGAAPLGATAAARSDALVFFGATGDLAYKQVFPALQAMAKQGQLGVPVIGVAGRPWTSEQLRERARQSLAEHGGVDPTVFDALAAQLTYLGGDYNSAATYTRLREALGTARRPLYYLAIPPSLFETVVEGLASAGIAANARVVIEKPFGRDLASAQELNRVLTSVFPDAAIFRIDHFLGKEPVQNLLYFRFANTLPRTVLEPQLRLQCADHDGRGFRRRRPR